MIIKIIISTAILFLILPLTTSGAPNIFNVKEFGAAGDGNRLETKAIQAAIDQCSQNGGTVYFPAGTYTTGTIILKSNVTLHLDNGCTILGSTNFDDYPDNQHDYTFFRGSFVKKSLIFAYQLENVGIKGDGVIDGQGGAFNEKGMGKVRYKSRPYLLWFVQCKNVSIENVRLQNSAFWMQHYMACDFVNIRGIKVYNHCNKNNDMMDIDGCHNVTISDCFGDTDDDAILLLSHAFHTIQEKPCVVDIPTHHISILNWLKTNGFSEQRLFYRMYCKNNIQPESDFTELKKWNM